MFKANSQSNVTSSQGRDFYMLVSKWQKKTTYSLPVKTMICISKRIFKEVSAVLENNLSFYLRAVSINIINGRLGFYYAWVNAQKHQWSPLLVMKNFKCQGT